MVSSVLLLASWPTAVADAPTTAVFAVTGPVEFPPGNDMITGPIAALAAQAEQLTAFTLSAERLRVCEYESTFPEVEVASTVFRLQPIDHHERCYLLTNAAVRLDPRGVHAGWMGFYPDASATFRAALGSAQSRPQSTIASPDADTAAIHQEDRPSLPFYVQTVTEPHLLVDVAGAIVLSGGGGIKVKGPDLVISALENTTRHETDSKAADDGVAREHVMRWLHLEFPEAEGVMESSASVLLAVRSADGSWTGRLSFVPVEGAATTSGARYEATGVREWVEGIFSGGLVPDGEAGAASLSFSGQMAATSIPVRRVVDAGGAPATSLLLVATIAGGAVVASGGGMMLMLRQKARRRPQPARHAAQPAARVEDAALGEQAVREVALTYAERAERLADSYAWLPAATLYRKARRVDPSDGSLTLEEGICLLKAGHLHRALCVFEEAGRTIVDGEAEYWAALCCARLGEPDLAASYARSGLDRPALDVEVFLLFESHPEFRDVLVDPAVRAGLEAARARLELRG